MPVLEILDEDGAMRWDALGALVAAIYFTPQPDLGLEYAALWRVEHQVLLPPGKRISNKTRELARAFGGKKRAANRVLLRKHRARIERIGTVLWLQAICSKEDPPNATESKIAYILGQLDNKAGIRTSRSTLKRDWARHRGTAHLCAAISYQRRVFGAPLLCHPIIGPADYSIYAALWDFIRLQHQFFAFALDNGCFAPTESFKPERDLWSMPPNLEAIAPRRDPAWPDCDRIRADVLPDPGVLPRLKTYSATWYRA